MLRYVDLTLPIHEGMTTYPAPWHPVVEVTQLGRHGIEGRETRKITLGTHTGTHIDAPLHFVPGGHAVDDIRLNDICGNAIVLDMTDYGDLGCVTANELVKIVAGRSVDRVLLNFGWDAKLHSMEFYKRCPWLHDDAVKWLVDSGCLVLGMDTPSPDNPFNDEMSNHKMLLSRGVALVEYLTNLESLPTDGYFGLIVAPLKIKGGDGAPARVFATILD